jgi:hypothetical protein
LLRLFLTRVIDGHCIAILQWGGYLSFHFTALHGPTHAEGHFFIAKHLFLHHFDLYPTR